LGEVIWLDFTGHSFPDPLDCKYRFLWPRRGCFLPLDVVILVAGFGPGGWIQVNHPLIVGGIVCICIVDRRSYLSNLQHLSLRDELSFSVGWSEASRFYYGSLLFSKSLYGVKLPLSVWHGTRYFLLAIPFLIHGLPIWTDRLWQVLLWLGITSLTSWLFVRRVRPPEWTTALILGGWLFLYLFQGAVYYHLQVCVIIILLGVSSKHPWRSLAAVIVSSFWAGMSRLNWFPVPAILAITLYLLEEPFSQVGQFWRYIFKPALWGVVGLATALLGEGFYIAISGNTDLKAFGSSLTSALLWYRWFPSPTNPIGIIPGTLIVSLPLFILIYLSVRKHLKDVHPLRQAVLVIMLLILLVGGLVVSTKIGGGATCITWTLIW